MRSNSGTERKNSSHLARRCRSPSRARRRRGCTSCGRTARSRRRPADAGHSAGSTTGVRSRSFGAGSATTRQMRGLSRWVMRLMTPPLPAEVAALEDHHDLQLVVRDPVLQLDQLALQPEQLPEIDPAVQRLRPADGRRPRRAARRAGHRRAPSPILRRSCRRFRARYAVGAWMVSGSWGGSCGRWPAAAMSLQLVLAGAALRQEWTWACDTSMTTRGSRCGRPKRFVAVGEVDHVAAALQPISGDPCRKHHSRAGDRDRCRTCSAGRSHHCPILRPGIAEA